MPAATFSATVEQVAAATAGYQRTGHTLIGLQHSCLVPKTAV
jgi:hypothetical protein